MKVISSVRFPDISLVVSTGDWRRGFARSGSGAATHTADYGSIAANLCITWPG